MGIDPRDSITSESLPDCCWPGPELFFPRRIVSVSARVPAADNPDKELRLPESSMDNRSDQPAKSAGDYRLHFPFFIPIPLSHWERARVRVRSLEKERKGRCLLFSLSPHPNPLPSGHRERETKMENENRLQSSRSGQVINSLARPRRPLPFVVLPRFRIAFECKCRDQVRGLLRQTRQSHPKIVLLEFHRLARRKHLNGRNSIHQVTNDHGLARPIMHVRIKGVALARKAYIISPSWLTRMIRIIDRRSVLAHPIADGTKNSS